MINSHRYAVICHDALVHVQAINGEVKSSGYCGNDLIGADSLNTAGYGDILYYYTKRVVSVLMPTGRLINVEFGMPIKRVVFVWLTGDMLNFMLERDIASVERYDLQSICLSANKQVVSLETTLLERANNIQTYFATTPYQLFAFNKGGDIFAASQRPHGDGYRVAGYYNDTWYQYSLTVPVTQLFLTERGLFSCALSQGSYDVYDFRTKACTQEFAPLPSRSRLSRFANETWIVMTCDNHIFRYEINGGKMGWVDKAMLRQAVVDFVIVSPGEIKILTTNSTIESVVFDRCGTHRASLLASSASSSTLVPVDENV
tara:strand:- start:5307 stop:6254 length:948 start_codon:yes stop_codon:yes gene_type:complete